MLPDVVWWALFAFVVLLFGFIAVWEWALRRGDREAEEFRRKYMGGGDRL